MRFYSWSMVSVFVACTLLHAEEKSKGTVSIKGESWKDMGPYDPERDGPPPGWCLVQVKDGPGFFVDQEHSRVLVVHGRRLDDAEPVKLPVKAVSTIALSADNKTLFVGSASDWSVWAFSLGRDGMPTKGRRAFDLSMPARTERLAVTALAIDTSGRLYAGTSQGIQVFDQKGKIVEMLSAPGKGKVHGFHWFGKKRDILRTYGDWSFSSFGLRLNASGPEVAEE